jgi:hypothetical protein
MHQNLNALIYPMIPFQNYVRQCSPPINMATVAKNRKKRGGMKFEIFSL